MSGKDVRGQTAGKGDPRSELAAKGADDAPRSMIDLIWNAGRALLPIVLTAGGLIGFIALAGSAIVWTRFSAAKVPADQVVAVYPRSELVAIASAPLLLFGMIGLLAVVMCLLVEPKGRASLGMSRAMLTLLTIEGTAVLVFFVDAGSELQTAVSVTAYLLAMLVCLWLTALFVKPEVPPGESADHDRRGLRIGFLLSLVLSGFLALLAGVVLLCTGLPLARVFIVCVPVLVSLPTLFLGWHWMREEPPEVANGEQDNGEAGESELEPEPGSRAPEPFKVPFTRWGMGLIAISIACGVTVAGLRLEKSWVLVSLGAAAILVAALWRAAVVQVGRTLMFGLAVFVSVPLFGTLTLMAKNVLEPEVQPMAMIRKGDGPARVLQGIYVTEADDRVYFATVATKGCSKELVPGSGRLLWVPKSEVAAISIGPLQGVIRARRNALEMANALSPEAASPPDQTTLAVAQHSTGDAEPKDRRLEDAGPALRPIFGAGLRLEPPTASPGEIVNLRMTAPNQEILGFGRNQNRHLVRLGGAPVEIVKERAHDAWDAEYVETEKGRALRISGELVFRHAGDHYSPLHRDAEPDVDDDEVTDPLFVRVNDSSVVGVSEGENDHDRYVELAAHEDGETIKVAHNGARQPKVRFANGKLVALQPLLLRQAWHEDHIRFRVPESGATGPLTVDCKQITGQPLLHVSRPPQAQISVRIEPGSERVIFSSEHSKDDNGKIVARRWIVQGLESGGAVTIARALPRSPDGYSVRLAVTDIDGEIGTAALHIIRVVPQIAGEIGANGDDIHADALRRARSAIDGALGGDLTSGVELDAHPPSGVGSAGLDAQMAQASEIREELFPPGEFSAVPADSEGFAIKTLAYGSDCPADAASPGGRVDILVLGKGVNVVSAGDCAPLRRDTSQQLLALP